MTAKMEVGARTKLWSPTSRPTYSREILCTRTNKCTLCDDFFRHLHIPHPGKKHIFGWKHQPNQNVMNRNGHAMISYSKSMTPSSSSFSSMSSSMSSSSPGASIGQSGSPSSSASLPRQFLRETTSLSPSGLHKIVTATTSLDVVIYHWKFSKYIEKGLF